VKPSRILEEGRRKKKRPSDAIPVPWFGFGKHTAIALRFDYFDKNAKYVEWWRRSEGNERHEGFIYTYILFVRRDDG
jgi:hypothetical protein